MPFEVFVDESGSTGPNLNEASQPVFVHAGLLIPLARKAAVRALAEQIRQEFLPKSEALHVGVLKTPNGRKRIAGLLRELAGREVLPLISIMERRIARAAYLVDTCFDYGWNGKADVRYMMSAEARQGSRKRSWLFEHKVKVGDIKSAAGRNRWVHVLTHLIEGVVGESGLRARGFGEMFLNRISGAHVEEWKEQVAALIAAGDYAPPTANGWLAVLRVIMKAAKRRHALPTLATEGITCFDESEHVTYTEEEPNALLPDEVAPFLAKFRVMHPEHYAKVYLGLITGLRPSSLRPLRRRGEDPDVLWDRGRVLVRPA